MSKQPKFNPPYGNLALEPTPAEAAAWDAMSREQQLEALRAEVNSQDASTDCGKSMDEIIAEIRQSVFVGENV
jgi:hypothetical protein